MILFRKEVLKGKLLDRSEVERWLQQQAELDGPPELWVEAAVPPNYKFGLNREKARASLLEPERHPYDVGAIEAPFRHVFYKGPRYLTYINSRGLPDGIPIASGGALERLKHLAMDLATDDGWREATALILILTGDAPFKNFLKITPVLDGRTEFNRPFFEIFVDACVPPSEVAATYRRERKRLLPGPPPTEPLRKAS